MDTPSPDKPPIQVFWALAVLGLTLGIYTGWSASPVVGSLISGVLGLLGGGALSLFLSRRDGKGTDKEVLQFSQMHAVSMSYCVMILCGMSLVGTVCGIYLRSTNVLFGFQEKGTLTAIPYHFNNLAPSTIAKLIVIQQSLDESGYPRAANNQLMERFAEALRLETPSEEDVSHVETAVELASDLRRIIEANEKYFSDLPTDNWSTVHTRHDGFPDRGHLNSPSLDPTNGPKQLNEIIDRLNFDEELAENLVKRGRYAWLQRQSSELEFLLKNTYLGQTRRDRSEVDPRGMPSKPPSD